MAPLYWDRLTWPEFVAKLEGYRERYSRQGREDPAYLRCLRIMRERPMRDRAVRTRAIVLFPQHLVLPPSARGFGQGDVGVDSRAPHGVGGTRETAADRRDFLDRLPAMLSLYASVLDLKTEIRTMGDTAASKFLHVLLPEAFVMWDNNIKPFARDYEDFLTGMHHLGRRLTAESGVEPRGIEEHLQDHLGYGVRKTLAKYLDEYNWYVAVGEE
jgi:hypothetical protein